MANNKKSNKKRSYHGKKNDRQSQKEGKAFRSGVESGESISKWDRDDKRMPTAQLEGANDWRWYAFNEQLLRDSASFAFSWPVGGKLNTGIVGVDARAVPGIMAFKTVPTFGQSLDGTSALNTAARNIYSFVRHANAGHTNYESQDLMLYLMAMDSIDSFISFMKRIYGIINLYTYENRYYPDALLMAMGVDPADFRMHIADFRAFINMFIVRVGSMCVPATMSYNARHMWMYDGIYVDSDTAKAQTYFYTPDAFYMYQLDGNGLGMLKYTALVADDDLLTVEELEAYGLALINPILTSEDMNIMSGDILKAFTDSGVIKRSGIGETYQIYPIYNEEVMSQFENITMMTPFIPQTGNTQQTYSPNLYQVVKEGAPEGTEGYLYYNPSFYGITATIGPNAQIATEELNVAMQAYTGDRILNMHKNDVTPADVMVASRLTNICSMDEGDNVMFSETIGSEVCTRAVIWEYQLNQTTNQWVPYRFKDLYTALGQYTQSISIAHNISGTGAFNTNVNPLSVANDIMQSTRATALMQVVSAHSTSTVQAVQMFADMVCALSKFDWHPGVFPVSYLQTDRYNINVAAAGYVDVSLYQTKGQVTNVAISNIIMDVDKYAVINSNGLRKMAEVALLSEFSVPQMGAFARKLG